MTIEYQNALAVSLKASAVFSLAQVAYRNRKTNDAEFLAARAIWDESQKVFDAAYTAETPVKKYTYSVYSPLLKKTFINYDYFRSEGDFKLFALALYSGNWSLISVE